MRARAAGYYFHPRSGNEASELKGAEQRQITKLFARQQCVTERNNGGQDGGDTPQYHLKRSVGMTPAAGLVAEVNAFGPWATRVSRSSYTTADGATRDVPLFADQRPWTSAWNKTADTTLAEVEAAATTDADLKTRLDIMTAGPGFALETDNARSTTSGKTDPTLKHFKICRQMLAYAKSKGKRTMLFLQGFEVADPEHYVQSNLDFVRALEDAASIRTCRSVVSTRPNRR